MSFRRIFTTATTLRHFAAKTKLPLDLEAKNLLNYTRLIQSFNPLTLEQEFSKLKGNIANPKYPDAKRNLDEKCLRIVSSALNGSISQVLLFMRADEAHLMKPCVDHLNELGFENNVLVAHSTHETRFPAGLNIPKTNIFSFIPTKEIDLINELKTKAPGVLGVVLGLSGTDSRLRTIQQLNSIKGIKHLGVSDKTIDKVLNHQTLADFMKITGLPAALEEKGYQHFDRVDVVVCEGDVIGMFKRNENGRIETYTKAHSAHFNNLRLGLATIHENYQGPLTLSLLIPHDSARMQARLLNVTLGISDHYLACKDNTGFDLLEWMLRQQLSRLYLPSRDDDAQSLRALVEAPHCFTIQIPILPCSSLRPHHPQHGETTYTLLNGTITDIEMPTPDLGDIELLVTKGSKVVANEHSAPLPIGFIRVSANDETEACEKMAQLLTQLQFYVNQNPVDFNLAHEKMAFAERLSTKLEANAHPTCKMR